MSKGKIILWTLVALGLVTGIGFACKKYADNQHQKQVAKITAMEKKASQKANKTNKQAKTSSKKAKVTWVKEAKRVSFPILMYHSISESNGNTLRVPANEFDQEMKWLKDHHYYTLSDKEAYRVLSKNEVPTKKIVWITLDDGYRDNYTNAFPTLKKYHLKATINLITDQIKNGQANKLTMDQIKEMQASGLVSFGSHTVSHSDLAALSPSAQYDELKQSRTWLNKNLHQNTIYACYPAGKHNADTLAATKRAGYKLATTTIPGLANNEGGLYGLSRVRVEPNLSLSGFQSLLENN